MRKFLSIVLVLVVLSCSKESEMRSEKEVVFKVGYEPVSVLSGYYKDESLLYFTDPATTQQIKLFDLKGNFKDSISLTEVINQYPEIADIHIFSLDTIVVTSRYINRISVLNRNGKIWKQLDLDNKVIDSEQNKYWLQQSSFASPNKEKDRLVYHSEWRGNLIDDAKDKTPNKTEEYIKYFNRKSYDSYVFVSVEGLFGSKPKLTFGLKDFYHEINDDPFYLIGGMFTIVKDYIYVFRYFSDNIFIIDKNTLELINKVKLTSAYTTIGIKPPVTSEDFDYLKTVSRQKGTIQRLLYDETKDEFYVILTKDIKEEKEEGSYRPFVVQCYDKNFKLKVEKEFGASKYSPFIAYLVEGELMLYKKNNNSNSLKNGEQIFEFFNFN